MNEHTHKDDCLFCKIVKKEIPAKVVWEDEDHLAFLDIHPVTEGHTLVIPKNHSENHLELSSDAYSKLFLAVKDVSEKIKATFDPKVVAVMVEGLEVPHTHVHLIPLNSTQELGSFNHIDISEEKLDNTHRKLTSN